MRNGSWHVRRGTALDCHRHCRHNEMRMLLRLVLVTHSEDSAVVRRRGAEARLRDYGEEATSSGAAAAAAANGAGQVSTPPGVGVMLRM